MFAINGRIECDPAHHDAAIAAMTTAAAATTQEAGCQAYRFSADLSEKGVFYIFELWESDDALKSHFKAPHMAAFQAALKECGPKRSSEPLMRYDISEAAPLGRPK